MIQGEDAHAMAALKHLAKGATIMQARIGGISVPVEHLAEPEPEPEPEWAPIAHDPVVTRAMFASLSAYDLAASRGHTVADYEGRKPQSAKGFTVADVRAL